VDAVHEDVDATEPPDGTLDESLCIFREREVAGDGESFGPLRLDLFCDLAKRFIAPGGEREATAFLCENEGGGATDTARGAGDDGYSSSETEIHGENYMGRKM
jgi:hypothetical protein